MNHARPAAFLDRDGTLIVEHGFLSDPDKVDPLPGAVEAVQLLNKWGHLVIGVTNQSGVARGYFGEATVQSVNGRVVNEFADRGAIIDAIYYCPHYPAPGQSSCPCRKPERGMIDRAMQNFEIDLPRSFVAGDRACDVGLGKRIGVPGILLLTGYGRTEHTGWAESFKPDFVADTLLEAVKWWGVKSATMTL